MGAAAELALPPPGEHPQVLILAGEHSGDEHASRLVRQFRVRQPKVRVAAVGGLLLKAESDDFLFDLVEHSVIGFAEVLKNYGLFKAFFYKLVEWIETHRPGLILFVDYPGFNLRLAAELHRRGLSRKAGGTIWLYYYIAPQVWAWKAKRRFKMAQLLDGLGCILPFEVETFADTELPTRFVGHPLAEPGTTLPVVYDPEAPVLLLPGSREQQVRQVFPLQLAVFERVLAKHSGLRGRVLYPSDKIRGVLEDQLADYPELAGSIELSRKADTALSGSAVLMSSGTMSLAVALAGMPGLIIQRVKTVTYILGRMLVHLEYIGLANLLLDRPLIPEYLQKMDTRLVADELEACLSNPVRREIAESGARELRELLRSDDVANAGDWLASCLDNGSEV